MTRETKRQQKLTVMIVGDSVEMIRPLASILKSQSYRVVTASNERCVAELLASPASAPSTIILAPSEHGGDALHFYRWLKDALNGALNPIPILLVHPGAMLTPELKKFMDQTAEGGIDRVLSSRLDREEVLAKVALLSERQRSALGNILPGAANSEAVSGHLPGYDSEARYRVLFDSSPLPMWVYDLETLAFLAVNKAAVRHYGYLAEEFLQMTIRDIRPAENVVALIARVAVLDMGLDMTGTWKHRKKSGAVIDVEITSHELIFDGRRARLVLANDVTERKRADLALAQQAEREALINRISSAVRRSLDPAEVFRTAVNELGVHLSVDRCLLFTLTGNPSVVSCAAEYVAPGIAPGRREYPAEMLSDLIQSIRLEGAITFDDTENDVRLRGVFEHFLRDMGIRSIMYVAIPVGDEIPAGIAFSTVTHARHWTETDVALAKAVAVQTGLAIRQAQLFEMVASAKEEWETTFNAMSDAVLIFNEDGDLTRANRAGAALESTTAAGAAKSSCCRILHAAPVNCIVMRSIAEKRRLTDEINLPHLKRALLFTAEPITGADGSVAGAVCSVRDLSELRKIEAVAREHQSLLRSVLDSAREAIYALDTEGLLQWCNKGVAGMGGYAPEELIGRHYLQWAHPDNRRELEQRYKLALRGEPQSVETAYFGADGQLRYAMTDYSPLIIEGRTTGVLAIARDITEMKMERERAAQADKLRALGQLASGVAHDFNNALAAIIGRAQLLSRLIQDATLSTHLDVIQTAAADAAATVRRIQTFARQPHVQEFELLSAESLLRDAIELTRMRWEGEARSRDLRYDVQLNADAEIYLEGTASELREVFVNLIVNALDAMPGGGSLSIVCRRTGESIQVLFTDTGKGMSEEVRKRIFEPFFTTKGALGTGLGLFVSYGIIERHQGSISVFSEPSGGTTFAIELPAIEAIAPRISSLPGIDDAHPLSILVVDDEAYVRETLAEFAAILAHRVVKAEGGRAAMAAANAEAFDLVLLDLSMPKMNGWETAREIRRIQPKTRIVLTTGYGQDAPTMAGHDPKLVDKIIAKPFTFSQIAELITQVSASNPPSVGSKEVQQKAS